MTEGPPGSWLPAPAVVGPKEAGRHGYRRLPVKFCETFHELSDQG